MGNKTHKIEPLNVGEKYEVAGGINGERTYYIKRTSVDQVVIQGFGHRVAIQPVPTSWTDNVEWVVSFEFQTLYAAPKPEAYKCPLRRRMAELGISQKALVFAEDFEVHCSYDNCDMENSQADMATGEKSDNTRDWKHEVVDERETSRSSSFTARYTGGTAALVYTVTDKSSVTYSRPKRITRIVVNPKYKGKATRWLLRHEDLGGEGNA